MNLRVGGSSTFLMLASVLAWSVLPLVFALSGSSDASGSLLFVAVMNMSGAAVAAAAAGLLFRERALSTAKQLFAWVRAERRRAIFLASDGILIAISNAAFVWALSRGEDALVTLVVEAWPVLASFILVRHISRFRRFGLAEVIVAVVATVGLFLLVSAGSGLAVRSPDWIAVGAAAVASLTQAGTVVIHQRLLQDFEPGNSNLSKNLVLQTSRMVGATAASILLVVPLLMLGDPVTGGSATILPSPQQFLLAIVGGALVVVSAILYARSLEKTDRPFKTLLWFLAPLISICLLALAGQAELTKEVIVGGTLIVAANVLLDKKAEPSWTLSGLVLSATLFGFLVLSVPGQGEARYFEHLQVLAAFYAIIQGFLLNRLWDRRRRVSEIDAQLEAIEQLSPAEFRRREAAASLVEYSDYKVLRISRSTLNEEVSNYSEAILLSLLGAATAAVALVGRPDTLVGAVNAFLIPVTVTYLLVLTWSLILNRMKIVRPETESEQIDTWIGYAAAVSIFVAVLTSIFFTYR